MMSQQYISGIAIVVKDYDEAIAFYTQKLNFQLLEDTPINAEKRWVRVAPPGARETALLLAKASKPEQQAYCGNQSGGRVFLFLKTKDFWGDYEGMKSRGVHFLETPRSEPYGHVVVFEDLYGNKWDLLEDQSN
ncbi:MAG: VOC family protein [Bacteroidota bacterium]